MLAAFHPHSALSIESLPLLSQFLMLALTIVTFILVYYLVQPWWGRRRRLSKGVIEATLPDTMTVTGRVVIQPSEVVLFNLLHLVSRDIFLLFAKIPFRLLVQVNTDDEGARRELVKTMRSLTADYVLVHPGTMLPSKIIMVGGKDNDRTPSNSPHTFMKMLCQEAEIDLIPLEANRNYSAMELTEILGLKEEE